MQQDTEDTPVRVSIGTARDSATRFRALLEILGLRRDVVRLIIPAQALDGDGLVRMGTWNPSDVDALSDRIEELQSAVETMPEPPLIGRRDRLPLPPAAL